MPKGKWLPPAKVASRVLCQTHNTALSPLDGFIGCVDRDLGRAVAAVRDQPGLSSVLRIDGHNLERWLAKALYGLLASGQACHPDGTPLSDAIPDAWVQFLFARSELEYPLGLYVSGRVGDHRDVSDKEVLFSPVITNSEVAGAIFELHWLHCILILVPPQGVPRGAIDSHSVWRPAFLEFRRGAAVHRLDISWDGRAGAGVTLTVGS